MAYTKIPVLPGDIISSSWGNHIQTQYEEAKADLDNHANDSVRHITNAERSNWNNKANQSGTYPNLRAQATTKGDVGLGNVQNYGIATQAQARAGTANNVYMTPLRVKEAIDALAGIVATKPRTADYNSSDRVVGTWYTVVDVSGSGILSRISMGTSLSSGNNTTLEVEIRIDGTTYVASPGGSSGNAARGLGRGGNNAERSRGFIDIFPHVSFRSNMRVRMRIASGSNANIMGAVDYSLT